MTSQKDGPPSTRMDKDRLRRLLALAQEDFARLRLHAKSPFKERWGDTSFAGGWCALPEGYLHALAELAMDRALFDDSDSEIVQPESCDQEHGKWCTRRDCVSGCHKKAMGSLGSSPH